MIDDMFALLKNIICEKLKSRRMQVKHAALLCCTKNSTNFLSQSFDHSQLFWSFEPKQIGNVKNDWIKKAKKLAMTKKNLL